MFDPSTDILLAESLLPAMKAPVDWNVLPASTKFRDRAANERFCPAFCGMTPGVKSRICKQCLFLRKVGPVLLLVDIQ